jgi:SAM-dependent methyltransferase
MGSLDEAMRGVRLQSRPMLEPDERLPLRPYVFGAEDPLPLTGERTSPGVVEENYWFQRHVVAYGFAAERVAGGRVLDAGCGEGYGTDILAGAASSVVGVDLEVPVIRRAAERYPRAEFRAGDIGSLPFPDESFDAVVSLQVIEHVGDPSRFLQECARVLGRGGRLVLSTPNRLTFSKDGIRNPFHTFEFAPDELGSLLRQWFVDVSVAGTFHGRRLAVLDHILRVPFPERLLAQPAPEWPKWLRRVVASVRPEDFAIRSRRVQASLDLVAVAQRAPD